MSCVSQSLPYVAVALGGLQLPRLLGRGGAAGPSTQDAPAGTDDPAPEASQVTPVPMASATSGDRGSA